MKALYLTFLVIVFTIGNINAQTNNRIGIRTQNPQGTLHIDTNGDNDTGGVNTDDVIVTSDGKVGIGTNLPTAKLDIRGTLRYVDGNQASKKVLVSDAQGNASWSAEPPVAIYYANGLTSQWLPALPAISNAWGYMGISVTLPAGGWQIIFLNTYQNTSTNNVTLLWAISTSSTTVTFDDDENRRKALSGTGWNGTYLPVTANYFVTPAVTTTYYIWAVALGLGNGLTIPYSGEGRLWAIPAVGG